ncbi:unnamed protein product, partial [Choristocarpus tenellus]
MEAVTPCILPDLREVVQLSVCSPRYFLVQLDFVKDPGMRVALQRHCTIYVKRRTGHLSYKNDPHALRSLLFQSFPTQIDPHPLRTDNIRAQSKEGFLSTFTEDPHLLNFAKFFCNDT